MRRPVCLFVLLFVAAVRAALLLIPPEATVNEKADGRYVTLTGTVEEKEFSVDDSGEVKALKLTLKKVRIESELPQEAAPEIHNSDRVLCTIPEEPEVQSEWACEGAVVRIRGKLRLFRRASNEGEFDAFLHYSVIEEYLFSLSDACILSYSADRAPVQSALSSLREDLSQAIDRIYAGRHGKYGRQCASVMKAMLLGQSSLLDPEIKERYQAAGILHVLCISGLHITLIGMVIFVLLRKCRVPLIPAAVAAAVLIYLYGLMTGMHTSCVRALIMFGLKITAKAIGRTFDLLTALSVAAALLLIEQPCYLYHSGFLFSFAAVAGAGILMPVIPKAVKPLAIPAFTLPVQLCFYYTFPLYSVLLNVIVLFLAPVLLAGGGTAMLMEAVAGCLAKNTMPSTVLTYAAGLAGEIPVLILGLFYELCALTEKLPFNTLTAGRPPNVVIAVYYALIMLPVTVACGKDASEAKTALLRGLSFAAAVFLLFRVRWAPPFALYMWDVGQGDGICIRVCDESGNCTIVIDGGSSSKARVGQNIEIPFLRYHGISKIDHYIVTHDDLDHCSGLLELLEQADAPGGVRIGALELPSAPDSCKGETYRKIEEAAAKKGIPVLYLHRGMDLTKGKLELQCLHPAPEAYYGDSNSYSVVLLLTYGRFSAVLTGDLEGQGEADLLEYLGKTEIRTDLLKAAHHGSRDGTSEKFLEHVLSRVALISCGKGNRYGHPDPETVKRMEDAGIEIRDTRTDGQITVSTDGRGEYTVHTFY